MTKEEKRVAVSQLNEKFLRANVAILSEFTGMGVEEIRVVRGELRGVAAEFKVVKNTLAIRAAAGTSFEGLNGYFKGSTVVSLGFEDPVAPIKALKAIVDKQKKLKIKAGVIEGQVIDLEGFRKIALLPSKAVLISELIGRFKSPITGFAGSLNGVLSKFVCTLKALHEKRSDES